MKTIAIIVPCYNEASNIPQLISAVKQTTSALDYQFSFILIDDGSTDDTFKTISSISKQDDNVIGIRLSRNFGKEAAITAALAFCDTDAAIIIDADLQHPPYLIPALIAEWKKGAEVVDGVKEEREEGNFLNNLMSNTFNKLMTLVTDMDFAGASDYKLLDRKVIAVLNDLEEKNRFFRGLTKWIGFKHSKIKFKVEKREYGKSSWTRIKLFRLSLDAITSYSSKPLHIISFLGILTLVFSFILGLQTLYNKISGNAVTGFTTVILIILILSSIIMISIGILGLYVSRIFKEVKDRPIFIIDKAIKSQDLSKSNLTEDQ